MNSNQALAGLVVVILLIAGFFAFSYNGFVTAENRVDQYEAEVQSELQNRYELIPNMVSVVEASIQAQKDIPVEYVLARNNLIQANESVNSAVKAGDLEEASRLYEQAEAQYLALNVNAVAEAVPEFDSTQLTELNVAMDNLQTAITYKRDKKSAAIKTYNDRVEKFPTSIAADIFGFEEMENFKAEAGAEKMPDVKIDM